MVMTSVGIVMEVVTAKVLQHAPVVVDGERQTVLHVKIKFGILRKK